MKRLTILLSLWALPLALYADGFDYSFVNVGFLNSEINSGPFDVDGDGLGVEGSFVINDDLFIIAGYSDQDYDFGIDRRVINVGVGFHHELSADLDFVADASYVDADVGTAFGSASDDGIGIGAGIRTRVSDDVELDAGLTYVDLRDSDTSVKVGARYYLTDSFALSGSLVDNDGGFGWSLGVRAEFGDR